MIGLVLPLLLVTTTTQLSLDRKRRSRKRNQNAVFTRSLSSTLLITTPTPSLVKTSLNHIGYLIHRTAIPKQNTLNVLMAEELGTHPAIYCSTGTLRSVINDWILKLQIFNFENHAFSTIAKEWGNDLCLS